MIIVAPPKVTLTYNKPTSEFTIKVTEIKSATYTLEYNWHSLDSEGKATTNTDALTNTQTASSSSSITDTQIAGTKSSDDLFLHDVQGGTLIVTAETTDGKTFTYQNTFKITETGTVKNISEQSSSKNATAGAVLGTSDEASASATNQALPTARPRSTQTTESTGTNQTTDQPTNNLPLAPLMIGVAVGVALLGIFGFRWYQRRQKAQSQEKNTTSTESSTTETTEQPPTTQVV